LPLIHAQGLLAVLLVAACERNTVAPDVSTEQLVGRAVALDVDLDRNTVTQASPSPSASVMPGLSYALLGHNEVTTTITNVTRSNLSGPYRVRIRFDLALTNNLEGADLVPATFPEPPVQQVVAFPFATEPSSWWGGRVRATGDWNGTGQPGSGSPWNFFNNFRNCWGSTPPSDCYRWEAYGEVLPAGATTPPRTVGFDIDPSVRTFRVYVVVAADVRERPLPAGTGGIAGTVSSAELGPLAGVQVAAGGQTATTGSTGLFTISGLAPGDVAVTLSGLPAACAVPEPTTVTVVVGQVTAVTLSAACGPTGPTMAAEVIAATSLQDGNAELYVLDPDGTNPRRLTNTTDAELFPAVSPDARRVAFIRRTGTGTSAQERLVVIDVDGANEQPLTDLLYDASNPTWSPDGQRIAFTCTLPAAWGNELCVVNADGSDLHIVLDSGGQSFIALYPDWDPTRDRIGHVPESVANPDGSFAFIASSGAAMGGVTTGQSFAISPAWSPDGTRLAFARITADGDIFVADAATGAAVNLTNSAGMENSPTWTRDGASVVYELAGNLYRLSASGGAPVQLTVNGLYANPHMR
jgi:TolB protein